MWFWSRGLGPSPSAGATAAASGDQVVAAQPTAAGTVHTANGLATVRMVPNQKTPIIPRTASAPAPSRSTGSAVRKTPRATSQVNPASTRPHSTMLPSSAAHAEATLNISGVVVAVTSATYPMEKSLLTIAACSTSIAPAAPSTMTRAGVRKAADALTPRLTRHPVTASGGRSRQGGDDGGQAEHGVHGVDPNGRPGS